MGYGYLGQHKQSCFASLCLLVSIGLLKMGVRWPRIGCFWAPQMLQRAVCSLDTTRPQWQPIVQSSTNTKDWTTLGTLPTGVQVALALKMAGTTDIDDIVDIHVQ